MRVCVLASSSSANSTLIESGETRILIDAGLSAKETLRRLAEVDVSIDQIQAICVSHEHSDHISGLRVLHTRHGVPIYANSATAEAVSGMAKCEGLEWKVFSNGSPFAVGELRVEPFSVPHDAYDPVGFLVHDAGCSIGVVTDMGTPTELIRQRLRSCRCLVLESNYDEDMLRDSARPWPLKQRIMGRQGHLSNTGAIQLMQEIATPTLDCVYLAHLSADCNRPELAEGGMREALADSPHKHIQVRLTHRDRVSESWRADNT